MTVYKRAKWVRIICVIYFTVAIFKFMCECQTFTDIEFFFAGDYYYNFSHRLFLVWVLNKIPHHHKFIHLDTSSRN